MVVWLVIRLEERHKMKRQYRKPQIHIENFRISTNIAGDCNVIITNATEGVCAYIDRGGESIFTSMVSACVRQEDDGAPSICYHTPLPTNDLFNS